MATTRLHVAGIAPNTTADDLRQLFAGVARVAKVTIPPPRDPQLPRGYAFVEVKNAADADACVAAYDNATWRGGRKLAVARRTRGPETRPGRVTVSGSLHLTLRMVWALHCHPLRLQRRRRISCAVRAASHKASNRFKRAFT